MQNPEKIVSVSRFEDGSTPNKLVGFDVFDTVLTRAVGAPEAIFALLARRLRSKNVITGDAGVFALTRASADSRSRANASNREVKLAQIYAEVAHALQLSDEQRDAAMREELILEEELLHPVPEMVGDVNLARSQGAQIVFVSDTYLPGKFVESQLRRHKIMQDGDSCYVSCEENATKWSKVLYRNILREEQVLPTDFQFCGNDALADVRVPRRLGINAGHFNKANLNRYERLMGSFGLSTGSLSSVFAGASRLARLRVEVPSPGLAAIRDVAAGVIGPALVGFAIWLLRKSAKSGTERLYFLARDGHLPRVVTDRLAKRLGAQVSARYLYSSRQAWLPACITKVDKNQLDWAFENFRFLSVESFLHRLNIEPFDVRNCLRDLGLEEDRWKSNLNIGERRALWNAIVEDARIGGRILLNAEKARPVLVSYLRQEGVFDGTPWAMVDLGWHASTQVGLHRLFKSGQFDPSSDAKNVQTPVGFYFGLRAKDNFSPDFDLAAEGYFLDERQRAGLVQNELPQLGEIMEIFCSPEHGPLEYLENGVDGVKPVLRPVKLTASQKEIVDTIQSTVLQFVDALHIDPETVDIEADVRPMIHDLIHLFWYEPSDTEARSWGQFPVDDRLGKPIGATLARPYRWSSLWRVFREGSIELPAGCVWFRGCFTQTPIQVRLAIRIVKKLAEIRDKMLGKLKPLWLFRRSIHKPIN